ncbi:MAG: branched-chain amino acid ABC transporter permease [Chloroflexi bacterium]|nr:branched-chain amino acid ABC transporter permease [Chloroflexota bacterium]
MPALARLRTQGIFGKNRAATLTIALLAALFLLTTTGMSTQDWVITLLRGLSVGAVTFLVASGFSLIFGLMDVLNLAHGTLFMIGAYIGWTVYIRPDTAIDLATPAALLAAGLVLTPLLNRALARVHLPGGVARAWPWLGLILALAILVLAVQRYPISIWDPRAYDKSPVIFGLMADQGQVSIGKPAEGTAAASILGMVGALAGGVLLALSLAGFARRRQADLQVTGPFPWRPAAATLVLIAVGTILHLVNTPLTNFLVRAGTNWLFLIAVVAATVGGGAIGALMESTLIRPLYARPIYQLLLTLGLGVIGRELVISIWGRTGMTMPNPALFNGSGKGCPATSIGGWLANQCSTISFMGSRIRSYNEIFIILVGLVVLIAVWLLLQRTRLGMIIRAGVQDSQMVEALGINVRRVFTMVFALGVALAALGGVLAGPMLSVADDMGESFLLMALIALAIGGLTSFPGAAAGSVIVALLQQFIVKYGQIGIHLPFLAAPFKPSPPIVPASTVLLMVIILLVLPQGLFGRKE